MAQAFIVKQTKCIQGRELESLTRRWNWVGNLVILWKNWVSWQITDTAVKLLSSIFFTMLNDWVGLGHWVKSHQIGSGHRSKILTQFLLCTDLTRPRLSLIFQLTPDGTDVCSTFTPAFSCQQLHAEMHSVPFVCTSMQFLKSATHSFQLF